MFARTIYKASRFNCRCIASNVPDGPPLMGQLKRDVKLGMRNKDKNRLIVLRGFLAQITIASKTDNPIDTEMKMLSLLRKNIKASKTAAEQFRVQGRGDLETKENLQVNILEGYAEMVNVMSEEEIRTVVKGIVDVLKADEEELRSGDVLRLVFSPEVLGGKNFDKGTVVRIVKEMVGGK